MEARTYSGTNGRAGDEDRWAVPVLDARRGGPAERLLVVTGSKRLRVDVLGRKTRCR